MLPDAERKLVNLFVKFVARTSPIRPSPSDIEAVANALNRLWPDQFEGQAQAQSVSGQGLLLLAMQRRFYVQSGFFDAPSLVLVPDSVEVHLFRKVNNQVLTGADADLWVSDASILSRVKSVFATLTELFPNYRYFRTSQMYKMDYGFYLPEEGLLIQRMLRGEANPEVGELRMTLTRYHEAGGRQYNYRCDVGFKKDRAEQPLVVGVQTDVNNRDMSDSLDPRDLEAIWQHGREMREPLLNELFAERQT